MRKLESRARDFVAFVKEQGDAKKTIIINHIEHLDDTDWVAQYGAKSNEEFYLQWIDDAGLFDLGADVRAIRAVD